MTDIEQTLAAIRLRDNMYPTQELTAGAVADRRTLLNIIDQMQDEIEFLEEQLDRAQLQISSYESTKRYQETLRGMDVP